MSFNRQPQTALRENKKEKDIKLEPWSVEQYLNAIKTAIHNNRVADWNALHERADDIPWEGLLEKDVLTIASNFVLLYKNRLLDLNKINSEGSSNIKISEPKNIIAIWDVFARYAEKHDFNQVKEYLHFLCQLGLVPNPESLTFFLTHPEYNTIYRLYDGEFKLNKASINNIDPFRAQTLDNKNKIDWLTFNIGEGNIESVYIFLSNCLPCDNLQYYSKEIAASLLDIVNPDKKNKMKEILVAFNLFNEKTMIEEIMRDSQSAHNLKAADRYLEDYKQIQNYAKTKKIVYDSSSTEMQLKSRLEEKKKAAYQKRESLAKSTANFRAALEKLVKSNDFRGLVSDRQHGLPKSPYALLEWLLDPKKIGEKGWKGNEKFKPKQFFSSADKALEMLQALKKEYNVSDEDLKLTLEYYKQDFELYKYSYAKHAYDYIYEKKSDASEKADMVYRDNAKTRFDLKDFFGEIYAVFLSNAAMPDIADNNKKQKEIEQRQDSFIELFINMGTSYNPSEGSSLYPHDTPEQWEGVAKPHISCGPGMIEQGITLCTNPDAVRDLFEKNHDKGKNQALTLEQLNIKVQTIMLKELINLLKGKSANEIKHIFFALLECDNDHGPTQIIKSQIKARILQAMPELSISSINQYVQNFPIPLFFDLPTLQESQICNEQEYAEWMKVIGTENLLKLNFKIEMTKSLQILNYLISLSSFDSPELKMLSDIRDNFNNIMSQLPPGFDIFENLQNILLLPNFVLTPLASEKNLPHALEIAKKVERLLQNYINVDINPEHHPHLKNKSLDQLVEAFNEEANKDDADNKKLMQYKKMIYETVKKSVPPHQQVAVFLKNHQEIFNQFNQNLNQLKQSLSVSLPSLEPSFSTLDSMSLNSDTPRWFYMRNIINSLIANNDFSAIKDHLHAHIHSFKLHEIYSKAVTNPQLDKLLLEHYKKIFEISDPNTLLSLKNEINNTPFMKWLVSHPDLFETVAKKTHLSSMYYYTSDSPALTLILINAGIKADAQALHFAIKKHNIDVINLLLSNGVSANLCGPFTLPLIVAIGTDDVNLVKVLLKGGADPNLCSKISWPLFSAIQKGNIEIIHALLNAGADVNHANEMKSEIGSLINYLLSYGEDRQKTQKILQLLIDHQCKVSRLNQLEFVNFSFMLFESRARTMSHLFPNLGTFRPSYFLQNILPQMETAINIPANHADDFNYFVLTTTGTLLTTIHSEIKLDPNCDNNYYKYQMLFEKQCQSIPLPIFAQMLLKFDSINNNPVFMKVVEKYLEEQNKKILSPAEREAKDQINAWFVIQHLKSHNLAQAKQYVYQIDQPIHNNDPNTSQLFNTEIGNVLLLKENIPNHLCAVQQFICDGLSIRLNLQEILGIQFLLQGDEFAKTRAVLQIRSALGPESGDKVNDVIINHFLMKINKVDIKESILNEMKASQDKHEKVQQQINSLEQTFVDWYMKSMNILNHYIETTKDAKEFKEQATFLAHHISQMPQKFLHFKETNQLENCGRLIQSAKNLIKEMKDNSFIASTQNRGFKLFGSPSRVNKQWLVTLEQLSALENILALKRKH